MSTIARQLVRASGSARLRGDFAQSEHLLAQAKGIDPENPALAIAAAREKEDSGEMLELLDEIEPVDDDQAILLELTRAGAEAARQDFEQARAHVSAAKRLNPTTPMVREVGATLALLETQAGLPEEAPIDRGVLSHAATELAELGRELSEDRPGAGAALMARASQAFSLAEEFQSANDLLDEALALEGHDEADQLVAEAALLLQRFDLVDSLKLGEGEEGRLNRAISHVLGEREVKAAAEELDRLIESDDEAIRTRAAFMRLAASSPVHDVTWSEEAEKLVVASEKPEAVAVLKAEFLAEEDQVLAAEKALAPFSSSAAPLRQLVGLAVRREDDEAAIRLSEELVSRYGEARDRLNHAGLLARQGEKATARDRFLMLARDASLVANVRGQAYGRATSLAMEIGDLVELERLSEEWLDFAPDEQDPVWLHIFALARRRRYGEALAFWDEHEIEIGELRQALLLSEIYAFGADPPEALQQIATLSDRFDRPEDLEYNLITTALRTEGEARADLGEDLEQRIKLTFADFTERFPDSDRMQAYKVDEGDPSGFLDSIRPQLEARAELGETLLEEIRMGSGATHVFAASTGRSVGEIWANLPVLPLGYSDPTVTSEERSAATDALAKRAAVWDPTSIYVIGGMGEARAQTFRNALPASLIAESTFEDVSSDLRKPTQGQTGNISYSSAAGGLVMGETPEDQREWEDRRAKGMAEMAAGFTIRTDLLREEEEELEEKLEEKIEELSVAARTWPATLAIARREKLAVFSDDRFVRLAARQAGIPAFGTLALLDVLAEQDSISEADRAAARRRIYRSGAWGMEIGREELVELVREDDFELTKGIRAFLNDALAWPARGIESVEIALALLNTVHAERREVFSTWVHLVVDSLTHSLGKDYERWTRFLISAALNPLREPPCLSIPAVQALIEALRNLDYFQHFPPRSDFVLDAINEALSVADNDKTRAWYFRLLIDLLGPRDRTAAIAVFVRDD